MSKIHINSNGELGTLVKQLLNPVRLGMRALTSLAVMRLTKLIFKHVEVEFVMPKA